jgi:hypothetical protein
MRSTLLAAAFLSLSLVAFPPMVAAQNLAQASGSPGAAVVPQHGNRAWREYSRSGRSARWQRDNRNHARWRGYRAARRHAYWRRMNSRRGFERHGMRSGREYRRFGYHQGNRGRGRQADRYQRRGFRGYASPVI